MVSISEEAESEIFKLDSDLEKILNQGDNVRMLHITTDAPYHLLEQLETDFNQLNKRAVQTYSHDFLRKSPETPKKYTAVSQKIKGKGEEQIVAFKKFIDAAKDLYEFTYGAFELYFAVLDDKILPFTFSRDEEKKCYDLLFLAEDSLVPSELKDIKPFSSTLSEEEFSSFLTESWVSASDSRAKLLLTEFQEEQTRYADDIPEAEEVVEADDFTDPFAISVQEVQDNDDPKRYVSADSKMIKDFKNQKTDSTKIRVLADAVREDEKKSEQMSSLDDMFDKDSQLTEERVKRFKLTGRIKDSSAEDKTLVLKKGSLFTNFNITDELENILKNAEGFGYIVLDDLGDNCYGCARIQKLTDNSETLEFLKTLVDNEHILASLLKERKENQHLMLYIDFKGFDKKIKRDIKRYLLQIFEKSYDISKQISQFKPIQLLNYVQEDGLVFRCCSYKREKPAKGEKPARYKIDSYKVVSAISEHREEVTKEYLSTQERSVANITEGLSQDPVDAVMQDSIFEEQDLGFENGRNVFESSDDLEIPPELEKASTDFDFGSKPEAFAAELTEEDEISQQKQVLSDSAVESDDVFDSAPAIIIENDKGHKDEKTLVADLLTKAEQKRTFTRKEIRKAIERQSDKFRGRTGVRSKDLFPEKRWYSWFVDKVKSFGSQINRGVKYGIVSAVLGVAGFVALDQSGYKSEVDAFVDNQRKNIVHIVENYNENIEENRTIARLQKKISELEKKADDSKLKSFVDAKESDEYKALNKDYEDLKKSKEKIEGKNDKLSSENKELSDLVKQLKKDRESYLDDLKKFDIEQYEIFKKEMFKYFKGTNFCHEKTKKVFKAFRKALDEYDLDKSLGEYVKDRIALRLLHGYSWKENSEGKYSENKLPVDENIFGAVFEMYENNRIENHGQGKDEPLYDAETTRKFFQKEYFRIKDNK